MKISETKLKGAYLIDIEPIDDERGFFSRIFCQHEFEKYKINFRIVQSNISFNKLKGTLRGLHYQAAPYEDDKLVRCTSGAIYDVIVDLRSSSATYLEWMSVELTASNHKALYIPKGFAHGFQTLADVTEINYQHSGFYVPQSCRGVRWDDPVLGIAWPEVNERVMSDADKNWPCYSTKYHTH